MIIQFVPFSSIYIINSDGSHLEEACGNYGQDSLNLSPCISPVDVPSNNDTDLECFRQKTSILPPERYTYNEEKTMINVSSFQVAGSTHSCSLSNQLNKNSKKAERKHKNLESVKTYPADSSFEDPSDTIYKEKRQRNNMAAKKSRDARKIRENQLKIKVVCLENANEILRNQVQREKEENKKQSNKITVLEQQIEEMKQLKICQHCSTNVYEELMNS